MLSQVLAPVQARLVQAAGQVFDHAGQVGPIHGLPDAVFLLPHGRRLRALDSMLKQESRERGLHDRFLVVECKNKAL